MFRVLIVVIVQAALVAAAAAQPRDQRVSAPTRLDWEFAARGFGAEAGKLPAGFDSTKQRYQLYVPKSVQAKKAAPLVLFISAGDAPAGLTAWQKLCEREGILFASPYAAGNSTPAALRSRIILDVLDDVRRAYRVDPDRTYLTGFSGGGRMSCAVAFALPELFGGVIPLCGTNPITGPTYLRHRIQDRLSVAFVTCDKDFNRKENEVYMGPWFQDLGIRSKVWVVPKMGHAIPSPEVHQEIYSWLEADLPRRREDTKAHPELAFTAEDGPGAEEQAKRYVAAARGEFDQNRVWRGITLLQGVTQRWGATDGGKAARKLLQVMAEDEKLLPIIEEQGAKDELQALSAQAWALERFGQNAKAIEAWQMLAKNYEGTPIARNAQDEIRRLGAGKLPPAYLGLGLSGAVIDQLAPKGPAQKAGLKVGDVLVKVDDMKVASAADLGRLMQNRKPGDRLRVEVLRDDQPQTITLEIGRRPVTAEK
jgi:pimeloyl-ACP methyl ester carboxylesterase